MNSETKVCFEALDENGKPFGWVVIDSIVNRRSHGGLRISPNVSASELEALAYKMTLKFGFVGIANGGAKAGVIGNPEGSPEERMSLLKKFCTAIQPLLRNGTYHPHPDMGTTGHEIQTAFGISNRKGEPTREQSGYFTSTTVTLCASVAVQHLGKRIDGMSAAIEGFGKVGSAVALNLSEMGVNIVAVSTSRGAIYHKGGLPVEKIISLSEQHGSFFVDEFREAEKIGHQELLTLPVELLCPCGAGRSIDSKIAGNIQAIVISAGANCPVLPEAEPVLQNAGILNIPDFISNCGGVLGGTMFYAGLEPMAIRRLIEKTMTPRLTKLLERTWDKGESISDLAEQETLERFRQMKLQAEKQGLKGKLMQAGISLHKYHLIPKFVMRSVMPSYFTAKMR